MHGFLQKNFFVGTLPIIFVSLLFTNISSAQFDVREKLPEASEGEKQRFWDNQGWNGVYLPYYSAIKEEAQKSGLSQTVSEVKEQVETLLDELKYYDSLVEKARQNPDDKVLIAELDLFFERQFGSGIHGEGTGQGSKIGNYFLQSRSGKVYETVDVIRNYKTAIEIYAMIDHGFEREEIVKLPEFAQLRITIMKIRHRIHEFRLKKILRYKDYGFEFIFDDRAHSVYKQYFKEYKFDNLFGVDLYQEIEKEEAEKRDRNFRAEKPFVSIGSRMFVKALEKLSDLEKVIFEAKVVSRSEYLRQRPLDDYMGYATNIICDYNYAGIRFEDCEIAAAIEYLVENGYNYDLSQERWIESTVPVNSKN